MTDANTETLDWALWFYWIMASTLGWLIGNLFFRGIPVIIAGVLIAALQWSVLFRRFPKAWRWFILSSVGWIGGYVLFILLFPTMYLLVGPVLGGAVGLMQWLFLRNEIDWSGWWIAISILAWTTGLSVLPGSLTSGSLPGALTGLALVILTRYAKKAVEEA